MLIVLAGSGWSCRQVGGHLGVGIHETGPQFGLLRLFFRSILLQEFKGNIETRQLSFDIVDAFLAAPFEGGRHAPRVEMIRALEG